MGQRSFVTCTVSSTPRSQNLAMQEQSPLEVSTFLFFTGKGDLKDYRLTCSLRGAGTQVCNAPCTQMKTIFICREKV